MKLRALFALALAVALTGCAQIAARYELSDLSQTQVFFRDGLILVGQEPVVAKRRPDGSATITFTIGAGEARFPERNAVTIDWLVKPHPLDVGADPKRQQAARAFARQAVPPTAFSCVTERPDQVTCTLAKSLSRGLYAYTIRVQQGDRVYELDPTVMMD